VLRRETENEERRRRPRWLVWLPVGLLLFLVTVAAVPFGHEVWVPAGAGRSVSVSGFYWECADLPPMTVIDGFSCSLVPPGVLGGPKWCWDLYLGAGLWYRSCDVPPRDPPVDVLSLRAASEASVQGIARDPTPHGLSPLALRLSPRAGGA
jgi:hypothetical protein